MWFACFAGTSLIRATTDTDGAVTLDQVQAVATQHLRPKAAVVAVVKP